jgi:hypothetical protein
MSAFKAVTDFPKVIAVVGALIWRESRGRLGGEDDPSDEGNDMLTEAVYVLTETILIC